MHVMYTYTLSCLFHPPKGSLVKVGSHLYVLSYSIDNCMPLLNDMVQE